ncbi:MAG: anti-sigma factor family protein [Armatimonadota bacterium]
MEKLNCEDAERLIHLKLDGLLAEEDAPALAEHTKQCAHCRELQEQLERVDAALREGLGAIDLPEPDFAATRQRVRKAQRFRTAWTTWLPAAAALLLVTTVVLAALQSPDLSAAPAMVLSGGDSMHVFAPDERVAQSGETGVALQERSVAWGLGGNPATLQFVGGARVGLSNEAVVRIGRNSIDLIKGALRVDLEDAEGDFAVATPWGDFGGGKGLFLVRAAADGGSASITVFTGEVTVESRGTKQVLTEGQMKTLQPDPSQAITL